jgi:hypothetical protein
VILKPIIIGLFTLLIVVCLSSFWWGQIDDELSDEANQLLKLVNDTHPNHAFLLLFGIAAPEEQSAIEWGKARLDKYNQQLAQSRMRSSASSENVQDSDKNEDILSKYALKGKSLPQKQLAKPEGVYFCSRLESNCIRHLFKITPDELNSLLQQHQVLRHRVEQFLAFDEYQTLTLPDLSEPFDYFSYLSQALRLELLQAIVSYKENQPDTAVAQISELNRKVRRQLVLQDTLIGKLVFAAKLADNLDVLSIIAQQEQLDNLLIEPLTVQEKSLNKAAAREFSGQYQMFQTLDQHPEFFSKDDSAPGWYARLFFKPNMTANALAPKFLRLARLSEMSYPEFVEALKTPLAPPTTSWLRNAAGNILLQTDSNFEQYAARMLDLDVKVYLFNHRHDQIDKLRNPYNPEQGVTVFDNKICFDGPFEDPRDFRCLLRVISD